MSLGKAIRRYRKQKDLRQIDLAEALGVHQSHVTRWEKDQLRPSQRYLEQLAEALEVTPAQLLEEEPEGLWAGIEDEELLDLVKQIPRLNDQQQGVLKVLLHDLLKLQRFQEVVQS